MSDQRRKGGRPKGTGYERADDPLVTEMIRMLDSGECLSRTEAAYAVVERARGKGTQESIVRRLLARCSSRDEGRYGDVN